MSAIDLTRQRDAIPEDRVTSARVTIVGAGAIGSHVAIWMSQMGISNLEVFDPDTVSEVNISNQGYALCHLGKPKVEALYEELHRRVGLILAEAPGDPGYLGRNQKIDRLYPFGSEIVISAVDNIASRAIIMDGCLASPDAKFFVDGRMAALYGEVYSVLLTDATSVRAYRESLFSPDEAYQAPCTNKATIFSAGGIASDILASVNNYLKEEVVAPLTRIDFANRRTY